MWPILRRRPRDEMAAAFRASPMGIDLPLAFNIAPSLPVLAVRFNEKTGERTIDALQWGLIPHFASDRKSAFKCVNARSETVDKLPSFRGAFAKRRCLIPADGFFEWLTRGKQKHPYAITRLDQQPIGIAGVWENWQDPATGEWVRSCAMITVTPNPLVARIHDRMPVILQPEDYALWLGESPSHVHDLKQLLRPLPAELMTMWPVSARMNSPKADDVGILDPIDQDPLAEPSLL